MPNASGGADEAEALDKLVDFVANHDFVSGEEKHVEEIRAERQALGLAPLPPDERHLNYVADVASCDFCGTPEAGKHHCSRCKCAFYCSAECQKKDWKVGGHKAACPHFEETCQALGRQTVADMADESKPPLLRVQQLERLDGEGAYKVAVEHGLHDVILKMLKDDAEAAALVRFRDGQAYDRASYAHFIMMTLWRGQRHARAGSTSFGKCDGGRVKRFIRSSTQAFPALWEACLAVAKIPLDDGIYRAGPAYHQEVHQIARDCLAGLSQIFTNDGVSKAILCGPSKEKDEAVAFGKDRIEYLALTTNRIIKVFNGAKEGRDVRDVLEGYIYQNTAMIAYRAREYGIDEDFASCLEMKPESQVLYQTIAVPLGEGTIKKGFALSGAEAQAAMRAGAAQYKQEKKASKKKGKGKKGRR
mmetsp:Transcript_4012/g.11433  ORF Transcript_4012/g.11433 Transcript_4012/m.11433 type:complete len:417 (-) Transcript_4012:51-1301(-)